MINSILKINNLEFGYKTPLCKAVNISAEIGDLICLVGLNGSGKSTFLNTISGILKPLSGEIFINKQNIKNLSLNKKSQLISYVPTRIDFTANLTVRELAEMGRSPYTNIFDKKSKSDIELVENILNDFDLLKLQNRQIWSLSDGEKQKAMIARALVQETPIIVLDEPSAFLDYKMKSRFLAKLKEISKTKSLIFSSHDIETATKFATKIWFINEEKLEILSPKEFIEKYYFTN
ncbi:MAG: ABC transporter ATP-binding protein [Bacteroidales bacterium]|nr:ABC transporter ATP-binding protein [Bacteroidales bacterium]MCK9498673.1 ABC transporter ATP-binding protein [Bacteroidales bacterium]MDY0313552.1 ABC transporter ATP-binding protein [Bacteroidales bacterium]NLB87276.1 ABC transporter ATP-binding protein [Bacteroidales bacterium]